MNTPRSGNDVMISACMDGSNAGPLSKQATVALTREELKTAIVTVQHKIVAVSAMMILFAMGH